MNSYRSSCVICETNEALCELFHRETSLNKKTGVRFSSSISRAFDNVTFICSNKENKANKPKKSEEILLKPSMINSDLLFTILQRKSIRNFVEGVVSFENLSTILRFSYGKVKDDKYTVPSAGGIYPIKLIIIIKCVEGLLPGIYEYSHQNLSLIPLYTSSIIPYENITQSFPLTKNISFSIHFLGSFEMVCYKYQDRGYRFINIECGHIAQNLSLISEALGIGSICSGGFLDGEFIEELKKYTTIDLNNYVELYEMFFGIY